ncbi:NB-ARC domain-containing protein [Leptolyngbya sp. AN03gr2]|uniref:WD40 domain-containing protein n=1 Tax=unclassified Leptolyngbya TaxID=2650499 RepID=UPI003D31CF3F
MPRSLKVRQDCIGLVKLSVRRNGFLSQQALAEDLGLARSTVVNFLTGKPVDRAVFEEICLRLSIAPQDIIETDFAAIVSSRTKRSRDLSSAPDSSSFFGRDHELATLESWILQQQCKLVGIFGAGGIGKTALSVKLTHQIESSFDYVIWRSLQNAPDLDTLLTELIQFLDPNASLLKTPGEKMSKFLDCLQQRCLIVLDNYETLLQGGVQAGIYRSGYENYRSLLNCIGEAQHQSCIILTSREKPIELAAIEAPHSSVRSLRLNGLTGVEGIKVFEGKGYAGPISELEGLVQQYGGNPLALNIVATTLQEFFDGNVAEFLKQEVLFFGDIWRLLNEQFDRLTTVEQQIMYWLAIERDWASFSDLRENLFPPVSTRTLIDSLDSLHRRSLIEKHTAQSSSFTQQPVVMEYMTNRLLEQTFYEIKTGQIQLLNSVSLIKAQAKDFIREAQTRLILEPLVRESQQYFRTEASLRQQLDALFNAIQNSPELRLGYTAGNLLNLYRVFKLNLTNYDFSSLVIRQAFLQDLELHHVNFSGSEFLYSSFTQTFGGILAVQFSPDGKHFATSSTNCEIQVWQAANKHRMFTLQGHTNWIRYIAFDPTSEQLASASDDGTIRIWDLSNGTCQSVLTGHRDGVYSVAFSPDGQTIASASNDHSIRLWNVKTGACLQCLEGHLAGVLAASFSPCGKFLASGSFDQTIRIWQVTSGACLQTLMDHTGWIAKLEFSPDGQWLASPSSDRTIRIWRVADWQCVQVLQGHTGWVWAASWSSDSQFVVSCGADCTAKIWDAIAGNCLQSLAGHTMQVWRAVFSPDGQTIATGGEDQAIVLWDAETGRRLNTITGYSNWARPLAASTDGQVFATGHKNTKIYIWNSQGECERELTAHAIGVLALAFHPDRAWLASGGQDTTIKIWDWQQERCIATLNGHTDAVWGLAFSPDGNILASSSFDQTIKLWRLQDGMCLATLEGHCDRVSTIAFHPSGELLASGSDDGVIKLWNVAHRTCEAVLSGHPDRVGTIRFSQTGDQLLSTSHDQTLKIWDIHTKVCLQTLTGHQNWVMGATFFSADQRIASTSADHSIKLWDAQTGACLNTLTGHTNWVWSVVAIPNSQTLISVSEDESIRIWDAQTGDCLAILKPKYPYAGMQIDKVTGLTSAQEAMLRELGAM